MELSLFLGSYSSIVNAVTALNSSGVGAGGATFNVAAGYTETITGTIVLTATGTAANPIIFQKSGAGANPLITSYTGTQTGTATPDGMWAIAGGDYITIDGIDLIDKVANTTATTTMEYGYGLFKASGTDGAQNNTIKNCVVTLNRANFAAWLTVGGNGSIGITVNNSTYNAASTNITVTAASGTNSYNKFYTNTIQNCNAGMVFHGYAAASPYNLADTLNDVGGSSLATGNTIINFGGGAVATIAAVGVNVRDQWGFNLSYNTINNNNGSGVNHVSTLRGIYTTASSINASMNINYNTLTIKGGGTTSQVSVIENNGGITGTNNTINLIGNNLLNCEYLTATSGIFYGLYNLATATNVNITNNLVNGINYSASALTGTGTIYGIFNSAITTNLNIYLNTVRYITRTGNTGGTSIGIYNSAAAANVTVSRNTVDTITTGGTGASALLYGIQLAGTNLTADSNNVSYLRVTKTTATSAMYGIYYTGTSTNETYRYNRVYNLTNAGTASVTLYGMYSTGAGTRTIAYNNIYGITGGVTVAGITQSSGLLRIYNNNFYDITSNTASTLTASGITIGSVTVGTQLIYNNLISRIYAPTAVGSATTTLNSVFGINITNATANNAFGIYNNTINIDGTSSGAHFASTCIYHTVNATTATLDLRNNILVNTSTPKGAGIVSVLRRSAATSLGNYSSNSDRNLFYTGASLLSKRGLCYDGTSLDSVLSTLQTRVSPRDANSISESPNFLNTSTGGNSNYLKIDASIATNIESGGRNVSPVSFDYANTVRAGNNGYLGLGGAPDLGAFEGDYTVNTANNMLFDSTTADQVTGNVPLGSSDVKVLRLRIHSEKSTNALSVTSFEFNTGASPSPSTDFSNAKVYYTNGDTTFSTSQLFGTVASPNGTFTITGNKKLGSGVNYFWLAYDIAPSANGGDVVDAMFNSVVVDGMTQTPLNGDPAGSRALQSPLNGNYYIGASQTAPDYSSISAALSDLSALGVSGPVTFILTDALYSSASSITLSNYRGASATKTVTFVPNTGVSATIECTSNVPTIDLNAAKYYIFDGRQGGVGSFVSGSNLVIRNTTNLSSPAIRFINDSKFNRISYCDLQSNNQSNAGTTVAAGVVYFGTTTTGGLGNDSNTINYCDIHENTSVSGTPLYAINSGGSTALVATNDNNTVDNCNIYNFMDLSAIPATPGSGINLGLSNAYWTITNNHFYHTTPRAYLGTGINRFIYVATSTGAGFNINNNYIGGISSNGSGIDTLMMPTGVAQYILMDINVAGGTGVVASNVQGNTITNLSITGGLTSANVGASIMACIGMRVSGNINVGTTSGNLIGSRTTNGAITYYSSGATAVSGGFAGINVGSAVANSTVNVSNNIISGITAGGNYGAEVYGIDVTNGVATLTVNVTNNMIGDSTLANSILLNNNNTASGGSSRILGLYNNLSTPASVYFNNNTIANLTSNHTLATVKGVLVSAPTTGGTHSVNNNLIYNIVSSSTSTATGGGSGLNGIVMGNYTSAGAITTCTGNKIYSLISNTSNAAISITGIVIRTYNSGTNIVNGNFIHGLYTTTQNDAALITGIDVSDGNESIINNIVRLGLDSNGASIVGAPTLRGIAKTGVAVATNTNNILFNTVYIGGTVDNSLMGDTNRTYAFYRNGTGTDTVVNNIFYNIRTNSTSSLAKHFGSAITANTGLIMDYNLLKGDSIGLFGSTPYLSMSTWKSGSGVDANSVASTMDFVNATGDKNFIDLHINSSIATAIEAYGIAVNGAGTTTDYDGQTRSTLTPHDLGADAGNFISKDVAAPSISYTAIPSDQFTTDRTITATITDATGVYLTGAYKPRVYFKKYTTGSWNSSVGNLTTGTATNGTWQFTVSASTLGGLVSTDTVYYFVTAQDITSSNNLGSYPGGIEGTDVNTISIYPNPFVFKIKPMLSGSYNVGVGMPFTDLTGTGGFFDFVNNSVLSGNISANITSDIEEPGLVELNQLTEAGAGGFTLTIAPDAASLRILTGTVASLNSALIRLNGADRITIDGSFGGSGKYLRIMNRAINAGTINLYNDAKYNTFANCYIQGVNNSQTFGMLNIGTAATGGTGNDSNTINNCVFSDTTGSAMTNTTGTNKPSAGVYSQTSNTLIGNDGIIVSNCEFKNIRFFSVNITTTGGDYWNINNNAIYADNDSSFVSPTFIYLQGGGGHIVRKNSIGGSAPDRSGAAYLMRVNSSIRPIFISSVSTIASTIDSNTLGNLSTTGSSGINYNINVGAPNATTVVKNNIIGGGFNPWDTITSTGSIYGSYLVGPCTYSNNVIGNLYNKNIGGTGYIAGINVGTISGTANITDNIVRDIIHPYSSVSYGGPQGPIGIYVLPGSTDVINIERNSVYNISAYSFGLIAKGIAVGTSSSNVVKVNANKIYNISVNVSGAINSVNSAAFAAGIFTSLSGTNTYTNNQISLGTGSNRRVIGYFNVSTAGSNYFYNNSIFLNGVGDTTSYGIYNQGAGTINAVNNLIYNKRTGDRNVTKNFAIGSATVALSSTTQKYNSFVLNDSSLVYEIGTNSFGWGSFNNLYSSVYNTNWLSTTSTILADTLFTDTVNNLSIKNSNPESWIVNGKGIALINVTSDNNGASRSTTIAGGSTDIGAFEFNTSTTPPSAVESATPATGTTTTYTFANRQIASVEWGQNGTIPTSLDIKYYTGTVSPSLNPAMKAYNGYYAISQVGGVGFDYNATLSYDSAMFGNIPRYTYTKVAMYSSSSWSKLSASVPNNVTGQLAGNTVLAANTLPAIFTIADTTTIPPSNVNLTIHAFLQGFYLGGGTMAAAPFNADGISPTNIADTITVELHDASTQALSYSTTALLNTNGSCIVTFPSSANGNSYYVVILHRNSITTWSSIPVLMSASGTSYNFSSSASQAAGSNLANDGSGIFIIYTGDINQDGAVDFSDYPSLDIASSNGVIGYDTNDLDGNGAVDFADYPMIDINSSNGVLSTTP